MKIAKQTFFIFISCFFFLALYSFPVLSSEFIHIIQRLKISQRLSDDFVRNYLDCDPEKPIKDYNKWFLYKILPEKKQALYIIVKVEGPQGIGKSIYSFTKTGTKIDSMLISTESMISDAGYSPPSISYDIKNNELIEVRKKSGDQIEIKLYRLSDDGKFLMIEH